MVRDLCSIISTYPIFYRSIGALKEDALRNTWFGFPLFRSSLLTRCSISVCERHLVKKHQCESPRTHPSLYSTITETLRILDSDVRFDEENLRPYMYWLSRVRYPCCSFPSDLLHISLC